MAKYLTKQRKRLQDYLSQQIDQELSAKQVAEDLAEAGVSLSAIYRNLAELEKEGLVVQCHKEGSRELYFRYVDSPDCQERLHLACEICKEVQHLSLEESQSITETLKGKWGFLLNLPHTVLYGVCSGCGNSG